LSLSIVPEIRNLQHEAGPNVCCFCLKALKRKRLGRPVFVCWSADCRNEENAARHRWRATQRRDALTALSRAVAAVGWSTRIITNAIGAP